MDDPLYSLFAALDALVLARRPDGRFDVRSEPPAWLHALAPDLAGPEVIDLSARWPVLDHFLEDAEEAWASDDIPRRRSGVWIESGDGGEAHPLEATALTHAGTHFLYLRRRGEEFQKNADALQRSREHLLTEEQLEAEVRRQTAKIRQREEALAMRLVSAINVRDEETGEHIFRIGHYAAALAEALGWDRDRVRDIRIAAPMHDVGKIGVPDRILQKPGDLTAEERTVMERHAEMGARMLRGDDYPLLKMACDIAWAHHENWDGTGYPRGLLGEQIPESARITSIVDVFDAMSSKRVYKGAMEEGEVMDNMRSLDGKKFDPEILEVFLENLTVMRDILRRHPDREKPVQVVP